MLQIISGKFFESDDRHIREGKGVLYSNISFHHKIQTCVASIETANIYGQVSCYIMNYVNQIEKEKDNRGFTIIRIGDNEIQRQFKSICTFGLRAIFDYDMNFISRICRSVRINSEDIPSNYVNRFFDAKIHPTQIEVDEFTELVSSIIGLPRGVYKVVINCLTAFEAALILLDGNINLSYSMLIYCIETLSQNFDNYKPIWEDYPSDQKEALRRVFLTISNESANEIKSILVKDEHLKLTKRFINFVTMNLDDDFFISDAQNLDRAIKKDETEQALLNAYRIRSGYAHRLEPIMNQIVYSSSKNNDICELDNNSYLTFNGLTRITHRVIKNFIKSSNKVASETYNWRSELPGMVEMHMSPEYWIGRVYELNSTDIKKKLEGLLLLIATGKEIPDMRPLSDFIRDNFSKYNTDQKNGLYCIFMICNSFIKEEFRVNGYAEFIKENEFLLSKCTIINMAMLSLPISCSIDISWESSACEEVINEYNKRKYKGNSIRLPNMVEVLIYLHMSNSYIDEDEEKQKLWLKRALLNSAGNNMVQDKIQEYIETNNEVDITSFFDLYIASRSMKKESNA